MLGGKLFADGAPLARSSLVRRAYGEGGGGDCGDGQERQKNPGTDDGADGAAVLSYVLTSDVIFPHSVDRGREFGDLIPEATVRQIELVFVSRPAHVDMPRLLYETASERERHGGRTSPVEVLCFFSPGDLTVSLKY